jgi:hypothetical protein
MSAATRYLCAAAHLRRSMLPDEIDDPDTLQPRPPRPVGRAYARRVLFERQGLVPMPGVELEVLRRHCYAAFRQTLIRDGAALVALGIAAFLAPWGTAFVLALIGAAVMLIGRVKVTSPLVLGVATGIAVALIYGRRSGPLNILPALIAIGACFLIYTADNFWAQRRMRYLLREPAGPDRASQERQEHPAERTQFQSRFNRISSTAIPGPTAEPIRVFYEKERIVGTGTPWRSSALTVAVDKPAQDKEYIIPFKATDLLAYITAHLRAQGAVSQGANGFAYGKVFLDNKWQPLSMPQPPPDERANNAGGQLNEFESFTHGLPDLDVREVIAVPVPKAKSVPVWWFYVRYVIPQLFGHGGTDQTRISDPDFRSLAKRPPTASPERHYVRATATTWDGQVITSIYVSAVLQGHYLRVLIRPYVLAPVGPELRRAGDLAQRNIVVHIGGAIQGTVHQGVLMIVWLHSLGVSRSNKKGARSKLESTREHYAQSLTDNLHHTEDATRMIQVMELKVFKVTREYLRIKDVDLADYDRQVEVYINSTVFRGNIDNTGGNFAAGNQNMQVQGSSGGSDGGSNGNK